MPSNRPNLTLDEQSFQGLLSAAFIIQQHNDRRKLDQEAQVEPEEAGSEDVDPEDFRLEDSVDPGPNIVCSNCGTPKPSEESQCDRCGVDELRPGERLQRNWASMWLMSQEQSLWPEAPPEIRESVPEGVSPVEAKRYPSGRAERAHTESLLGEAALEKIPSETKWAPAATENAATGNEATENAATEDFHFPSEDVAAEESELAVHPLRLSTGDDAPPNDADLDDSGSCRISIEAAGAGPKALLQRLADLRVTLRFRRADLYLGTAIFIAALALLWPAAGAPQPAALGPWERALVMLGIAEAPAPAVHLQGDPGIEVWVDPHTALYYCPGEDPYGKTPNGRLASQREAQMDRFEPASRSACE